MTFQALNLKKKHFLDLLDDDYILIMPTYMKGNAWLKLLSHSNFLYVRVTRAITNHVLIEEYCLRFFSKKSIEIIQLNQDIISFMSIEDIITIGIPIKSC